MKEPGSTIATCGLNVIARYDQNFNYKPANTWWHFLGTYTDLMVPAAGNQVDANIINFLALGSVVMPLSIELRRRARTRRDPQVLVVQ